MSDSDIGRVLLGDAEVIKHSWDACMAQAIDWDLSDSALPPADEFETTLDRPAEVSGHGTFFNKATRTLVLEPCQESGWWFDRTDLAGTLPIRTSVRNVWTTGSVVSNIVLRSGPPHNYMRMVEHIIALKFGLGIDNLTIRVESGDPPIFDRGSLDLVQALEGGGLRTLEKPIRYYTVKETVTVGGPHGSFVTIAPSDGSKFLHIDCAVDFPTAIGKQRIRFPLTREWARHGAEARTNTSLVKILYSLTLGRLFADIRHMGYNPGNVLIASKFGYFNKAHLVHEGKSLEAVWHRAVLDLVAALSLMEEGRLAANVTSYKAGHWLDVQLMRRLYREGLLVPLS
jgi:UDP-3-O-[3-hydroxymyristoyl] N-acetylglucosamine deacetylase